MLCKLYFHLFLADEIHSKTYFKNIHKVNLFFSMKQREILGCLWSWRHTLLWNICQMLRFRGTGFFWSNSVTRIYFLYLEHLKTSVIKFFRNYFKCIGAGSDIFFILSHYYAYVKITSNSARLLIWISYLIWKCLNSEYLKSQTHSTNRDGLT